MHTGLPRRRDIAAGAIVAAVSVVLSACAAKTSAQSQPSALDRIKKAGAITIAMDASYEPNEFRFHGQIIGFDVDLGTEIARNLGVTASVRDVKFDKILPGVQNKKYDLGMSSLTDNEQREQDVDFVTYFSAGTGLMVKAGNPLKLSPAGLSLCGRKVAVQKGTTQEDELIPKSSGRPDDGARVARCKRAGKPAPVKVSLTDQDAANLALAHGRADAVLADSPVASYAAKESNGKFATAGKAYNTEPYGIAIPKNETDLRDAIQKIVMNLIGNGIYKLLTDKWGISDGGISGPEINGAGD